MSVIIEPVNLAKLTEKPIIQYNGVLATIKSQNVENNFEMLKIFRTS
jgi:hypothetical protein